MRVDHNLFGKEVHDKVLSFQVVCASVSFQYKPVLTIERSKVSQTVPSHVEEYHTNEKSHLFSLYFSLVLIETIQLFWFLEIIY